MNHEPSFPPDDAMEHEWALQEQAAHAERLHLGARNPPDVQAYRTVVRALKQPLDHDLPPDFAHHVSAMAERRAANDTKLELYASALLFGMLIAMLIGLTVTYGSIWLQWTRDALPAHSLMNPWLLALIACFALCGALEKWIPSRDLHHDDNPSNRSS